MTNFSVGIFQFYGRVDCGFCIGLCSTCRLMGLALAFAPSVWLALLWSLIFGVCRVTGISKIEFLIFFGPKGLRHAIRLK